MIQRIQTIYFSGIVILSILMFFIPFGEVISDSVKYIFTGSQIRHLEPGIDVNFMNTFPLIILLGVIICISATTIFFYRKRALQVKMSWFIILLLFFLEAAMLYYVNEGKTRVEEYTGTGTLIYRIAVFFPLASIVLCFLAKRAIKKDEELIRSANRIR